MLDDPTSISPYPQIEVRGTLVCNGAVSIHFSLPESGQTELALFDINGRLAKHLHSGALPAGTHTYSFNLDNLPSGVYIASVSTLSGKAQKKITLLK